MKAGDQTRRWSGGHRWPVPADERLDRAMVAGLMLEVVLEAPGLPDEPRTRRRLIKSNLTDSLLAHLAGRVTLDRFRTLVNRLEQWFPFYYPLMPPPARPSQAQPTCRGGSAPPPGAVNPPQDVVRLDPLHEWLVTAAGEILPQRPQRKIQPDRLEEFLLYTGLWFRVKDLARAFDIDRKTAWEYLQKFQDAGLLVHNGGRSAAVRYRLADDFLKVRMAALQQQVAQALAGLPRPQAEQVTEWLTATAGEPFWEDRWPPRLGAGRREEMLSSLKAAQVLETLLQSGQNRLLRLQRRWLRSPEE